MFSKIISKIGLDPFVIGIFLMVLAGYFFPQLANISYPFSIELFTDIGVGFIFLFYGLKLNLKTLKSDLNNWKLHCLIQGIIFVVFPLFVLCFYPFFNYKDQNTLWLSFFFLSVLPSTVSSSVVMVSIAGGNIPSAIFNASISSLLGIFITPLWMGLFLSEISGDLDLSSVYYKLLIQVLLPLFIGLLLNNKLGTYAQKHKNRLKLFDQLIILLIVYTSFSHSFSQNLFSNMTFLQLLFILFFVVVLFFLVYGFSIFISNKLKFSRADRITLSFCASKKSLIHGTVLTKILFPNPMLAGLMLLPIMIYHAFQLIIVSVIAKKEEKKSQF